MIDQPTLVRLTALDAEAVQGCFDSQPKLMMTIKNPGREPYARTFRSLLASGCVSYGLRADDEIRAFCVVWPWPSMPASTIVLACNRPIGQIYNPQRSGLQATLDACLRAMESEGRRIAFFVRSTGRAWKGGTAQKGTGRLAEYFCTVAERIPAGRLSRYSDYNRYVLGNHPVPSDAVVVVAAAPMDPDL